ncbi:hypothetical protein [Enterococcus casseliflavus]|uniref:hypothetical protein n=1 Tax=Enterococcus casseliflavus TaxID=37734 RepID=UPI00288FEEA2|nr:hypothetical protein [Enterococcus casseliflavus]MDT2990056.1 hypothetical protein [Enterococcus casseliflavus]
MSEIKKLAKELQEYTRIVGSHNEHIQSVANRLVELTDQPQLNENQQVVLEWLKGNLVLGYGASLIRTIYLLQRENTIEIPENRYIRKAYRSLSTSEEATVVQLFIDWALEQEEG